MSKWDSVKGNMRGGAKPPLPMPKCDPASSPNGDKKFFDTKLPTGKLADLRKEK